MIRRRRSRSERALARQQVRVARIERKSRINELRKYILGHAIGVFSADAQQDLNISNEEIRQLLVSSTDEEIQAVREELQKLFARLGPDGRACAAESYMDFIDCVSPDQPISEEERSDMLKKAREAAFGYEPVGEPVPDLTGATTIDPTSASIDLPPVSGVTEGWPPELIDPIDYTPGGEPQPLAPDPSIFPPGGDVSESASDEQGE